MNKLTKQEQLVLSTILFLLVVGWVVKVYRAANPPSPQQAGSVHPKP